MKRKNCFVLESVMEDYDDANRLQVNSSQSKQI